MANLLKKSHNKRILRSFKSSRKERKRHIKLVSTNDFWSVHGRHIRIHDQEARSANDRPDGSHSGMCVFGNAIVNRGTTVWILRILRSRGGIVVGITSDTALDSSTNFTASPFGFGYGSSGAKHHNAKASKFFESFRDGDVVTVNLDLEESGKRVLSFCKNTNTCGVAFKNLPENCGFRLAVLLSQPGEQVSLLRSMCNETPRMISVTPPANPVNVGRPHSLSPKPRRSSSRGRIHRVNGPPPPPRPPPPLMIDAESSDMKVMDSGQPPSCLIQCRPNGSIPPTRPRSHSPPSPPPNPPTTPPSPDNRPRRPPSVPPHPSVNLPAPPVLPGDGPLSISAATFLNGGVSVNVDSEQRVPPVFDRSLSEPFEVGCGGKRCQNTSCRLERAKVGALIQENRLLRQKLEKYKERIQTLDQTNKTWLQFYEKHALTPEMHRSGTSGSHTSSGRPSAPESPDMDLDDVPPLPPLGGSIVPNERPFFDNSRRSVLHSSSVTRVPLDQDDLKTIERPEVVFRNQRFHSTSSSSSILSSYAILSEFEVWMSTEINLPEYLTLFQEHGFDRMDILSTLTRRDLEALGVHKKGHQRIILRAISSLHVAQPEVAPKSPPHTNEIAQPCLSEGQCQPSMDKEGRAESLSMTSVNSEELFAPGSDSECEGGPTLRYLTPGRSSRIIRSLRVETF